MPNKYIILHDQLGGFAKGGVITDAALRLAYPTPAGVDASAYHDMLMEHWKTSGALADAPDAATPTPVSLGTEITGTKKIEIDRAQALDGRPTPEETKAEILASQPPAKVAEKPEPVPATSGKTVK